MRVLRVIASMDPRTGGPCQGIRNTVPVMISQGVENEVVCMDSPHATYLKTEELKIHALGPSNYSWAYSSKLLPWLSENISRFDRVIVHGLWLYPGHAFRNFMIRNPETAKRIKWYLMPHGMLDPYFQKAPGRKFKAVRNQIYWQLIERKVVKTANGLLFTCAEELALAKQTFKRYEPAQSFNVGYGIQEPPSFTPLMESAFREKVPSQNPFFLFLSRVHPKKGVDLLLEAYLNLVKEQGSDLPDLVIAGPGMQSDFGKKLANFVAENAEITNKVHFCGMLSGNAKWGAFYACEAFILPSHQENFGIAVAEAMACQKPVIISDKVNIWREIAESGGGIVGEDTSDGVYRAFSRYLEHNSRQLEEMGVSARKAFERNFHIHSHVQRLIEVLEK